MKKTTIRAFGGPAVVFLGFAAMFLFFLLGTLKEMMGDGGYSLILCFGVIFYLWIIFLFLGLVFYNKMVFKSELVIFSYPKFSILIPLSKKESIIYSDIDKVAIATESYLNTHNEIVGTVGAFDHMPSLSGKEMAQNYSPALYIRKINGEVFSYQIKMFSKKSIRKVVSIMLENKLAVFIQPDII